MNFNDPEEMKRQNEVILNGRRMIVRFKKGGRIREERIYDSADTDWETQWAIANTLYPTTSFPHMWFTFSTNIPPRADQRL